VFTDLKGENALPLNTITTTSNSVVVVVVIIRLIETSVSSKREPSFVSLYYLAYYTKAAYDLLGVFF
jgi:hypothetical protein